MTKYLEKGKLRWHEFGSQWVCHLHLRRKSNGLWYNNVVYTSHLPPTDEEWASLHKPGLFFLSMTDALGRSTHRWVAITEIMCD